MRRNVISSDTPPDRASVMIHMQADGDAPVVLDVKRAHERDETRPSAKWNSLKTDAHFGP